MIGFSFIAPILIGIAVLLLLVLYFRIHAFIALLIASITAGLLAGLDAAEMIATMQKGMGGTLGFVATVVGLGAIFGAILEHSGGAQAVTKYLLSKFGKERAPTAMLITGFFIAIPVFFDVAFIILIPIIYSLQRESKKSLLLYAIPLLAGLAITHAFIPPTPGPVAVADIINVDLGSVILVGFIVGIPTAIVSGLLFGKYIAHRIHISAPELEFDEGTKQVALPSFSTIFMIILVPIILILANTATKSGLIPLGSGVMKESILLLGHPFAALILANLLAWYFLGIRRGYTKAELQNIAIKSLAPAGAIILLTGAGGVFKQVLVDTKIGEQMASTMSDLGISVLVFAFIAAALVRVIQGSATVAMITAAGLVAPLIANGDTYSSLYLACIVISIASGASIFSHVNDSGFWLVSQYLGMNEKQTFRSWTMMTTVLAITGFSGALLVSVFV